MPKISPLSQGNENMHAAPLYIGLGGWVFKGEVQSRITIILKERVKISLQIGAKNYENRIRNKEVVSY